MCINKVCGIIDFDGFNIRKYSNSVFTSEFLIREIGFIQIDPENVDRAAKSCRFDLSFYDFGGRQEDVWRTINYQTRYVTGLTFKPGPEENVYDYTKVESFVTSMYNESRWAGHDVVAFKGGIEEKKLLDQLSIPHVNLEDYGCPKYKDLLKQNIVRSPPIDCGYHKGLKVGKVVHCPKAEVTAFRDWLLLHYPLK